MKINDEKKDYNGENNNIENNEILNAEIVAPNSQNNKGISLANSFKLKSQKNSNKRYYQNEEKEDQTTLSNTEINYIELFNEVVKSIDKIIFQKKETEKNLYQYKQSSFIYNSINEEEIDYNKLISETYNILFELYSNNKNILLLKNKTQNTLTQYYKSSGLILVSLEIINIYYKIYINEIEGEEKFCEWLINDNKEGENVLEIGIGIQTSQKEQISFYNKIFEYIEKSNNRQIIYKIISNRKENIFILCAKEEKLFLLLFLYEKIKKFYPSENPLDIKNKIGLVPLHFSSYYLSREITNTLLTLDCKINNEDNNGNIPLHFAVKGGDISIAKKLILYGSDKNKLNKKKLSPEDYANKYGNYAMKNLFTKNPFYKTEKIKNVRHDYKFLSFFFLFFILKLYTFKIKCISYIVDIFCLSFFLYFNLKKKDYYLESSSEKNSKEITIESLLEDCNYDKNKIKRICPKCKLIQSLTMKHCMVCNLCVDDFDHHCFWINKCINNRVYKLFIIFLLVMLIEMIINFILFFIEIKKDYFAQKDRIIDYYMHMIFMLFYLFIFAFGITFILSMLYERIKGLIYSRKKLNLEEKLLNKKNDEESEEDNKEIGKNKNNITLKIKEDNKEEEIEFKDLKI